MKEVKNIRIWKLNTPIRNALFGDKYPIVGVFVSTDFLNQLAIDFPYTYLSILHDWKEALYNQIAFRLDEDGRLHVACFCIKDDDIVNFDLACSVGDGEVTIIGANNRFTHGQWLTCKSQERSMLYINKKSKVD